MHQGKLAQPGCARVEPCGCLCVCLKGWGLGRGRSATVALYECVKCLAWWQMAWLALVGGVLCPTKQWPLPYALCSQDGQLSAELNPGAFTALVLDGSQVIVPNVSVTHNQASCKSQCATCDPKTCTVKWGLWVLLPWAVGPNCDTCDIWGGALFRGSVGAKSSTWSESLNTCILRFWVD